VATLAAARLRNPDGCIEILGGSECRTQPVLLPGLELVLVARPAASAAGGDLYCLHSCGDYTLAKIVLLDVTGHGERAARAAQEIHPLLHQYSAETDSLGLRESAICRIFASRLPGDVTLRRV
jgi:hypothetical protein